MEREEREEREERKNNACKYKLQIFRTEVHLSDSGAAYKVHTYCISLSLKGGESH